MSDEKGQGSKVVGQIVAAVVIALLVGGTAPWWWKVAFPDKGGAAQPIAVKPLESGAASQKPPIAPTEPEVTPPTPDSLSKTAYSLAGDAILHFRVVEIRGRDMTIEVDYHYNAQHGERVMVGAHLKGVSSGYVPTFVPAVREGAARIQMSANEPGMSTDIDIFLYEYGRPAERFAQRTFPYQMRFE